MTKLRIKIILSVIILACLLSTVYCLLPSHAQESSKEEESLFVAKKAFEDGFYEVSQELLERFLKNYPGSSQAQEVNLLVARCLFQQNRYLDALSKFEAILKDPSAKNVLDACLYWTAEVHFKGNNFDKAREYYKRIIDEYPKSVYIPASYYSLGWCLFQQRKYNEALEYFKIVEERFPKEPQAKDASFKTIECLYNLKDYNGLKVRLKNYLKTFAKDRNSLYYIYFYLAEADYYLNNFTEAINEYSQVLKSANDERTQELSRLGIGWSYIKLKQYKEAESVLSQVNSDKLEKKSQEVLLLARAIVMTETSRLEEAKKAYEDLIAVASEPQVLIQAYLGKADALYNLGLYQESISVYQSALEKSDNSPGEVTDKLHYGLAWAFLKQGVFKDAIKEFQKIVKGSDDNIVKVSALCQIGDAYQDSGEFFKAQETYDTILKDYPDSLYSDYVQYQSGLTLLKQSNYSGAVLSFQSLKKNYPESKLLADATYCLALAFFQKQDYASSKEVLDKFQAEFADSSAKPQALYLLATSLYNLGKFSEAIEAFKDIIKRYNQDSELIQKAEYEIADCLYQMGNEKEAMERFKQLRSRYPDSTLTAEIMWWLGSYYYRHNELDSARRYFSSLIQDFPKSNLIPDAYYALGSTYEDESRHDEAAANFKKVLELGKQELTGQAAIAIADIYARQEKFDLALSSYKDIARDYPNLVNLTDPKMADLYYKSGDYNQAVVFYRKSLEKSSPKEAPGIQLKIAEVLQAGGKPDLAIEEYLKVTYLYSEDSSLSVKALLRVAEIYEDKQNFKEASNIYQRIISMNTPEAKYARERQEAIKGEIKGN